MKLLHTANKDCSGLIYTLKCGAYYTSTQLRESLYFGPCSKESSTYYTAFKHCRLIFLFHKNYLLFVGTPLHVLQLLSLCFHSFLFPNFFSHFCNFALHFSFRPFSNPIPIQMVLTKLKPTISKNHCHLC